MCVCMCVAAVSCSFMLMLQVLLTGTPVQNSLRELYALLLFVAPDAFPLDREVQFLEDFSDVSAGSRAASALGQVGYFF
jgi:SNF2 family DNA or RNA helicase